MKNKLEVMFKGINRWGVPVFMNPKSKSRYGSLDILFKYGTPEDEVLERVTAEDLVFLGNCNNCDPMGTEPIIPLTIIRENKRREV